MIPRSSSWGMSRKYPSTPIPIETAPTANSTKARRDDSYKNLLLCVLVISSGTVPDWINLERSSGAEDLLLPHARAVRL